MHTIYCVKNYFSSHKSKIHKSPLAYHLSAKPTLMLPHRIGREIIYSTNAGHTSHWCPPLLRMAADAHRRSHGLSLFHQLPRCPPLIRMAADALPFGTLGKIILVPTIHSHINRAAHMAFPYCAFGIVGKIISVPLLLSYYGCVAHGVLPYCALFVHSKGTVQ